MILKNLFDWSIEWLIDLLFDWLILIDWLLDDWLRVDHWMIGRLIDWLSVSHPPDLKYGLQEVLTYVALSRTRNIQDADIVGINFNEIRCSNKCVRKRMNFSKRVASQSKKTMWKKSRSKNWTKLQKTNKTTTDFWPYCPSSGSKEKDVNFEKKLWSTKAMQMKSKKLLSQSGRCHNCALLHEQRLQLLRKHTQQALLSLPVFRDLVSQIH